MQKIQTNNGMILVFTRDLTESEILEYFRKYPTAYKIEMVSGYFIRKDIEQHIGGVS